MLKISKEMHVYASCRKTRVPPAQKLPHIISISKMYIKKHIQKQTCYWQGGVKTPPVERICRKTIL